MENPMPHKLTMNERSSLNLTGVTEIISFDEGVVILKTTLGQLTVQGSDLKLKNLSLEGGQAAVSGRIDGLSYEEPREPGGFWHRLLR